MNLGQLRPNVGDVALWRRIERAGRTTLETCVGSLRSLKLETVSFASLLSLPGSMLPY